MRGTLLVGEIRGAVVAVPLLISILLPVALPSQLLCEGDRRGLIPGDITLGFLFPFYASSADGFSCGTEIEDFQTIQLLEAAIYTINNDDTSATNGIKIGVEAWDTCNSGQGAVERTMEYLGDRTPTRQTTTPVCSNAAFKPIVIGHLGNDEGPAVSSLLTDARVPIISYAATQATLTTDEEYAFFSRNIPSDDDIARALVGILKRMGWTYIAMVATDNSEERSAGQTFQDIAESNGICVAISETLPEGTTDATVFDQVMADISAKPNAKVVVLFTSSDLALGLYGAADRSSAEVQWVLGHRALYDQSSLDQQPLITRGLLGVLQDSYTPTHIFNSDFDNYFKGLTPGGVNATVNPWFLEFYQDLLGCDFEVASGSRPLCTVADLLDYADNYVRSPYYEGVKAAVEIAVSAVRSLQEMKCPGMMGVCGDLLASTPQDWLDAVRSQQAFRQDGSTSNTRLNIYNMKGLGDGYALQNVGSWQDGSLTFDPASVDSWTGVLNQPVMSMCGVPCLDPACSAITTNNTMAYMGGDIILGGLFSVHSWNETNQACGTIRREGILYLEAMLYALDQINSDSTLLPGLTLGLDGLDTCSNPRVAGEATQDFITEAEFGASGSGKRIRDGVEQLVYGVIGPEGDDEVATVNRILSFYGIPLIAYDSYDSSLSNSISAPNLARVTPNTYADTIPLARALGQRGIRYVQMLYTTTFSSARSVFNSIGRQNSVCVAQSLSINSNSDWEDVFLRLASRSEAKFIVLLAEPTIVQTFISELEARNLVGQYHLVGNGLFPLEDFLQNNNAIRGLIQVRRRTRTFQQPFVAHMTSLRPETNVRNPWFAEFWMDHFQCELPGYESAFTTPCTGSEALTPDDIFDSTVADVVDATYTMARSLHDLQQSKCPASNQLCPDMIASQGSELFQMIIIQIFTSPFDQELIRFNPIGDVVANFYIYNYQLSGNSLSPVQIASYVSYAFSDTNEDVIVYNENGVAVRNPVSNCSGLCDECNTIDKGDTAYIQGDIWIGGFFSISEEAEDQYTCTGRVSAYNMQLLEAFLFAVDMVNNDNSVLQNFRLGAVGFDTCGSTDKARREVSNYVGGTVEYRTGYFPTSVSIAGVIGGQTSDTSLAIADVLNGLMVNQISFGASTTELSDDSDYPYFLRTLPSDAQQAKALVDLISRFDWSYVSVVYSQNAYGNDINEQFGRYARDAGICIAMALGVPSRGVVNYLDIVSQLVSNPQSKVVVLLTSDVHTKGVLEAAEVSGAFDLQWIGGDTWGNRKDITANATTVAKGTLIVELQDSIVQGFEEFFTRHTSYSNNRNPWWQDYIMETFQCQISGRPYRFDTPCTPGFLDFSDKFSQAPEVGYVVNAVMAFAVGVDEAIKSLCPNLLQYEICQDIYSNPSILHDHIRRASFIGADGRQFMFDDQGDGEPRYNIINLDNNLAYTWVGTWVSGVLDISQDVEFFNNLEKVNSLQSNCSGRCAECSQASATRPTMITRGGELQIAALFAAHYQPQDISTDCGSLRVEGVVEAEALLYAINDINSKNSILPGVTLGTTTLDTCESVSRGVSELSYFLSGGFTENHQPWYQVAGVLSGGRPDLISNTATVSQEYQYTQVSYSSVGNPSADLISIPASYNDKASALVGLLMHYSWSYVAAVYDGQDRQQRTLFSTFLEVSYGEDICVGLSSALSGDNQASVLQDIEDNGEVNVVVVFADAVQTKNLLEASQARGGRRPTFILAFPQEYPANDVTQSFVGSLALFTVPPPGAFQEYFTSLNPADEGISPWFVEYIENKFKCDVDSNGNYINPCSETNRASAEDVFEFGSASADIIDSVWAVAQGTHNLLQELCGENYNGLCASFVEATASPGVLQDAIADVSFTGSGGQTVSLSGGVRAGQFNVWNGQQDGPTRLFSQVGTWSSVGLMLNTDGVQLFDENSNPGPVASDCTPGSPCQGSCSVPPTTPPPITRRPSPSTQPITTPDRSNAVPFSSVGGVQFYILVAIAAIGAFITLVMMIVLISRWSHPSAVGISSFLHLTLLIGILLLFVLVPINSSPETAPICALQRVLAGIGYAFCYVSVFLLVTRLYRIGILERRIAGKRASYINNSSQVMFFGVFIAIEIVFLVQWLVQQPVTDFIYSTDGQDAVMYCGHMSKDTVLSLLYVYVLMILSLVISIQAWCSIKVVFTREFSVFIAAMSICIIVMVAWIIADVIIDAASSSMLSSVNAIVQGFVLLIVLVVPKAKLLCSGKHDEFWESASVTSSEYGGNPRPQSGDFDGIENYPTSVGNEYEVPVDHTHDNPAYDSTLPDKSMDLS